MHQPPRLPLPPDFDHDRLDAELRRRGWNGARLARECPGIAETAIRNTLRGLRPSPRVRAAIEHALSVSFERRG